MSVHQSNSGYLFQYTSYPIENTSHRVMFFNSRVENTSCRVQYTRCRFFSKPTFLEFFHNLYANFSDCRENSCCRFENTRCCNQNTRRCVENTSCRFYFRTSSLVSKPICKTLNPALQV